jgi:arsenite/tail-anchored protein-transporting ATPase
MRRMAGGMAKRIFMLPWLTRPPVGFAELSKLVSVDAADPASR